MEYRLLHNENNIDSLKEEVDQAVKDGWKPKGDVSTVNIGGGTIQCVQAMVK